MSEHNQRAAARDEVSPGTFIGAYRVIELQTRGDHWDVYLARSSKGHRHTVLKILRQEAPPGYAERLQEAAARVHDIEHGGIAHILEAGDERGYCYVAEEYVEGPRQQVLTLAQEIENHGGRLPEETVRVVAKQVLAALGYAHRFRGRGVPHGHLRADKVLLTPQRRVKLIDVGLPLPDEAGTASAAADMQSFADLLQAMLMGPESAGSDAVPSAYGCHQQWDRIVARCRNATPERLPDMEWLLDEIMTLGEPRRHRRYLLAAAVGLMFALTVAGVVGWRRYVQDRRRQQERRETAARIKQEEQISKWLEYAQAANARGRYDAAEEAVNRVLDVVPGHAQGQRLLQDIRMSRGLEAIGGVKTAADEAWSKARNIDPNDGFAARLQEIEATMAQARRCLTDMDFKGAETNLRRVVVDADELLSHDAARKRADERRSLAEAERELADDANAAEFAAAAWTRGQARFEAALEAFDEWRFEPACEHWAEAEAAFRDAGMQALGERRVTSAKAVVEAMRREADADVIVALPAAVDARLQAVMARAEAATESQNWDGAARAWNEAELILREALGETADVVRRERFETLLKEARDLAGVKAFADAETHVAEALRVPGFGAHEGARELLRAVRAAQIRRVGTSTTQVGGGELVLNGGFERGDDAPLGWQRPDNLTVFWEAAGVPGKCLHLDTDVYRSEWEAHRLNPDQPVTKTPTSGTRYNTVGGTSGVAVYSHPIPVAMDAWYRVRFDVKGQGEPFLFLKGFWKCAEEDLRHFGEKAFFHPVPDGPAFSLMVMGTSGEEKRLPRAGDYIQSYRRRVVARFPPGKTGTWRRFTGVVHLEPKHNVEVVMLELYAFWPPGDYYFDNVSLRRIGAAEADAYEKERQRLGAEANFGVPVTP